jgi:hypothetical protein
MRAAKGEGAATPEEIAEFSEGLVCLADVYGRKQRLRTLEDSCR